MNFILIDSADSDGDISMNSPDENESYIGDFPLHSAVKQKDMDKVVALLNGNMDVNCLDMKGNTPLILAVKYKDKDMAQILLDRNAVINCSDMSGNTPLFLAVTKKDKNMAQILLDRNADVNCSVSCGFTPLHFAVLHINEDMAQFLLDKNADVNCRTMFGETPLILAVKNKDKHMAQILLDRNADVNCRSNCGLTPLHFAVMNNIQDMAQFLLDNNADVNCRTMYGETPLIFAVKNRDKDMAQILLDRNADVNCRDSCGLAPLLLAVMYKIKDMAQILLDRNADVNCSDSSRDTPLILAVKNRDKDMAQILLDRSANLISVNNEGRTPLHHAISVGDLKMAEFLFLKGSESGLQITPTYYSTNRFILHDACLSPNYEMMFLVLSKFSTKLKTYRIINLTDENGNTPLNLYISRVRYRRTRSRIVNFLLINGANVNIVNKEGHPPLVNVCRQDCDALLQLFLDYGAEIGAWFINYLDSSNSFIRKEMIIRFVNLHNTKLRLLNQYVDPVCLDYFRTKDNNPFSYENEYKKEICKMKNETVIGTHLSYHSLLIKNNHQLARCLNNDAFVKMKTSDEYKKEFPRYGGMLFSKLKKAEIRMELLNVLDKYCYIIFPTLPVECVDFIFSYLSEPEMLALIDAVSK